ncbi:hypothetical protein SEA_EVEPICKLES_42 [Arthrobacter phage EvePickles]|nr:hypothetical protein SEA_EVEPICKLES_42 [Arthrobacter phage EvePickles]
MAINSGDPSAAPLTDETTFASEQGAHFDAMREAYEAAQAKLLDLIDGPDKSLHFSEYRAQLNAALQEQQEAHDAMMAAWEAPRIMLGMPVDDLPEDWSAIAATHMPIMEIHHHDRCRKPEPFGEEEFGIVYPTFLGGKPDRVLFYATNPAMNTLENMEAERQRWIDRGEECYVVSRQWTVV